jgi:hypothetical protein
MFHGAYEGAADMVDWPKPERFGFEFRKVNAVVNAYYYICLQKMTQIAAHLGHPIDAAQYSGTSFSDVEAGQWYSAAVEWASQNGIVLGVGGGRFDPEGQVTREQMAAILYRYADYRKIDTSGADTSKFDTFTDKALVSDWAKDAMIWATSSEIINGMGDSTLAPQNSATRAQVAQIVKNYNQKSA